LRGRLRRVPANESTRHSLLVRHDTIEVDRSIRYEHATRAVPRIFWTLIGGFLVGAMVMNGRYRQTVEVPKLRPVTDYMKPQGRFRHLRGKELDFIQRHTQAQYELLLDKCGASYPEFPVITPPEEGHE